MSERGRGGKVFYNSNRGRGRGGRGSFPSSSNRSPVVGGSNHGPTPQQAGYLGPDQSSLFGVGASAVPLSARGRGGRGWGNNPGVFTRNPEASTDYYPDPATSQQYPNNSYHAQASASVKFPSAVVDLPRRGGWSYRGSGNRSAEAASSFSTVHQRPSYLGPDPHQDNSSMHFGFKPAGPRGGGGWGNPITGNRNTDAAGNSNGGLSQLRPYHSFSDQASSSVKYGSMTGGARGRGGWGNPASGNRNADRASNSNAGPSQQHPYHSFSDQASSSVKGSMTGGARGRGGGFGKGRGLLGAYPTRGRGQGRGNSRPYGYGDGEGFQESPREQNQHLNPKDDLDVPLNPPGSGQHEKKAAQKNTTETAQPRKSNPQASTASKNSLAGVSNAQNYSEPSHSAGERRAAGRFDGPSTSNSRGPRKNVAFKRYYQFKKKSPKTRTGELGKAVGGPGTEELSKPVEAKALDYTDQDAPEFKVFTNPLLVDKIATFLDHSTLKELSSSNALLLDEIRKCKKYIDNTKLSILPSKSRPKGSGDFKFGVLKGKYFIWKTVKVEIFQWRSHWDSIMDILSAEGSKVEALELVGNPKHAILPAEARKVDQLVLAVKNLKSLSLETGLLLDNEHFRSDEMKAHLRSLQALSVIVNTNPPMGTFFVNLVLGIHTPAWNQTLNDNLLALSSITETLRVFRFLSNSVDTSIDFNSSAPDSIIQIIERNKNKLQDLSLCGSIWSSEALKTIICSSLHTLEIEANSAQTSTVAEFIRNQPLVTSLVVEIQGRMQNLEVPNVIRDRSQKLQRLSVRWAYTPEPDDNQNRDQDIEVFDWSFLQGLAYLKELYIRQPFCRSRCRRRTMADLLPLLPPTLRKLGINGVSVTFVPLVPNEYFVNNLARLTQLTTLNLLCSKEAINDERLQWICSNMRQLLELGIYGSDITDFGVTGKRENEDTGISLRNIKGLKKLSILQCHQVSYNAFRTAIAHVELKELRLTVSSEPQIITQNMVIGLASQNPSLEVFKLGYDFGTEVNGSATPKKILAKIRQNVPRFKVLEIGAGIPDEEITAEEWQMEEFGSDSDGSMSDDDFFDDFDDDAEDFFSDSDDSFGIPGEEDDYDDDYDDFILPDLE